MALTSGTTYTLAWQNGSPDLTAADSLLINYPTLVVDPNVTVANQSRFENTGSFTFPTTSITANNLFRGMVNAQLTSGAAAVPEPASLTVLGIGILSVAGYSWRRRGKARA